MKTLPLDLLRRPLGQRPGHRTPKPPGKEKTAGETVSALRNDNSRLCRVGCNRYHSDRLGQVVQLGNKVTPKTLREAEVGQSSVEKGTIPGPRRDPC